MDIVPLIGLLGLIGLAGFAGLKSPVEKGRSGVGIRLLALLGFFGVAGFWIPGTGAADAMGALGLWNHQNRKLALWGKMGWIGVIGLFFLLKYWSGA